MQGKIQTKINYAPKNNTPTYLLLNVYFMFL